MIQIYSDKEHLNSKYKDIGVIWAYFDSHIFFKDFDSTDEKIMATIDQAVIKDREFSMMKTTLGVANKSKLSSGCKTALIVNYLLKNNKQNRAIDVISCGGNALSIIYDLVNDTSIALIQRPMITDNANTEHTINYNDGEFTGNFNEYCLHLIGLSYEEDDEVKVGDKNE